LFQKKRRSNLIYIAGRQSWWLKMSVADIWQPKW